MLTNGANISTPINDEENGGLVLSSRTFSTLITLRSPATLHQKGSGLSSQPKHVMYPKSSMNMPQSRGSTSAAQSHQAVPFVFVDMSDMSKPSFVGETHTSNNKTNTTRVNKMQKHTSSRKLHTHRLQHANETITCMQENKCFTVAKCMCFLSAACIACCLNRSN